MKQDLKRKLTATPFSSNYFVTKAGQVFSDRTGKLIELTPAFVRGYKTITIYGDNSFKQNVKVHRLVLETFIGPMPKKLQVRHLDGNKHNNALSNLIYGTSKQNAQDRIRHGTINRGERHSKCKLTLWQARIARRCTQIDSRYLSKLFGVRPENINLIRTKKNWAYLPEKNAAKALSLMWKIYKKLNFVQFRILRRCDRESSTILGKLFGINNDTTREINTGKRDFAWMGWDRLTLGQVIKMRWSSK